jgi:DNA (cytosine-5)-methyltransferase 1
VGIFVPVSKLKVVSLFCGCGGADVGLLGGFQYLGKNYKKLPYEICHASDIDLKAINTYKRNFLHQSCVADIKTLTLQDVNADLVIGGFPCQPFSTVNPNKEPHKKESQLFWEMARVINEVKPKAFIAENVKGFYRLKQGYYFQLACKEFESLGYDIFHSLINSSDYGVPQKRERIFIIGIKKSLKLRFTFPNATHGAEKGLKNKVALKSIVKSLYPDDPKYFFSKRAVEGVKNAKPNMKRALAQDLNGQCLTITSHLAKVSLNSRDPVLLVNPEKEIYRRFSPREAAGIQSFPENFTFAGSEADAYRQIGNAIPPVVMWNLAKQMYETLN